MKTIKAVSYTAEVDWRKIVNSAWRAGFLTGISLGVGIMMIIYLF